MSGSSSTTRIRAAIPPIVSVVQRTSTAVAVRRLAPPQKSRAALPDFAARALANRSCAIRWCVSSMLDHSRAVDLRRGHLGEFLLGFRMASPLVLQRTGGRVMKAFLATVLSVIAA